MNTLLKLLYVSIVTFALMFMGCEKDPVIPSFCEFGDQAGPELVVGEQYVDAHRGGLSHPDACDAIANKITKGIQKKLYSEIIPELDMFVASATEMYRKKDEYKDMSNWWKVSRTYLIKKLKGKDKDIVDDDVVRVLPLYAEMLDKRIIPYVMDNICYGGGVRDVWTDNMIKNTFVDTIPYDLTHQPWVITPWWECYYYFYYYAVDPGNYAEAKSMGMNVPSVDSLMVIFPIEEIKNQTDLREYRKESIKKYDFMQADWKPVPTSKVQMYKDEEELKN